MENKVKAIALLSLIAVAAVVGGIMLAVHADATTSTSVSSTNEVVTTDANTTYISDFGLGGMDFRGRGFGGFGDVGGFGQVEVSADFAANVTNIAKADSDVINLLNSGYNITSIRPIIKEVVDGQGNVAPKATSAVVVLENGTTNGTSGHATVLVDLEKGKVTEIVTTTRTVLEKP